MTAVREPAPRRPPGSLPPWAVFPLLLPWSVSGTFLLVTMAYFLSTVGVSIAAIAVYASAVMIPDTFKVLWAPLVDTTLGPKRWHAIGVAGTIAGLAVIAFVPVTRDNMPLITGLAIACGMATTLVHLANDIFVTYDVDPDRKGRAAGWGSASNLGGGALGGGLAIYIAHLGLPAWCPAFAVALICAAASPFVLMPAPRPPAGTAANQVTGLRTLMGDVLEMIRSRKGATALFLVILPMGSIGMMNLVPALARDWHAGAMAVVFVNGIGGGLVQIVGALVGGVLADRIDRKLAYCLAGAVIAAIVAGMAMAPRTPLTFIVFTLLYLLAIGTFLATFSAIVFEAAGGGGAAATKCMLMVCATNLSSDLTGPLDGYVHDSFGLTAMLFSEVALGIASIAAFGLLLVALDHIKRRPARGRTAAAS